MIVALMLSLASALWAPRSEGSPNPIQDRPFARSQQWLRFTRPPGFGPLVVHLTGFSATCEPGDWCPSGGGGSSTTGVVDVWARVLGRNHGEVGTPVHCTAASCDAYLWLDASAESQTDLALMIHGGVLSEGRHAGYVSVTNWTGETLLPEQPVAFSDNVMLDVFGFAAPRDYDVTTVLVPDGPRFDASGTLASWGNPGNDHLGIAATEIWLVNGDDRLIGADLQTRGVTSSAKLTVTYANAVAQNLHYVLVRPRAAADMFDGFQVKFPDGSMDEYALLGDTLINLAPGRMRFVLNAWYGADADDDHLSNAIERQIGTCDGFLTRVGGWPCMTAEDFAASPEHAFMDPRDTDGDGLSDSAEVLGADVSKTRPLTASGACSTDPAEWFTAGGQTFPLWNFSPLHKDMLVEIDVRLDVLEERYLDGMGNPQLARRCDVYGPWCRGGFPLAPPFIQHTADDMQDPAAAGTPFRHPAPSYRERLAEWWLTYSRLDATRVNNPDGQPGIEVHFDATAPWVTTAAHGYLPEFTFVSARFDPSGALPIARSGVIVYRGIGRTDGSTCGCSSADVCPHPRNAGFAHYAMASDLDGGGQANCNDTIYYGVGGGLSGAHEAGHHLGLAHGGIYREFCGTGELSNPFAPPLSQVPDATDTHNIVHVSQMTYGYAWAADPTMPFSIGARAFTPYPWHQNPWDATTPIGYDESAPFTGVWGATTSRFRQFFLSGGSHANFTVAPVGCEFGDTCTDVDLNANGTFTDFIERDVTGGSYRHGIHAWVRVPSYDCVYEARVAEPAGSGARCCGLTSWNSTSNQCEHMGATFGPPSLAAVTNTMMLAASPAAAIINNRLVAFYIDDLVVGTRDQELNVNNSGQALPRRCSQASAAAGLCARSQAIEGRLRWVALDRFARPDDVDDPTACLHDQQVDCVVSNPSDRGTVLETSGPNTDEIRGFKGSSRLAATVFQDPASPPGTETLLLAWARRPSFLCEPGTNACRDTWQRASVRFATLQATSPASLVVETRGDGTLQFPAGHGDHVSGVTAVAWDPATNGGPTRALVIAREASGMNDATTGQLFYALCDASGCPTMQPLNAPGYGNIHSASDIAAAVDHPAAPAAPSVSVWFGQALSSTSAFAHIARVEATGGAMMTSVRLVRAPAATGLLALQVPRESAVSLAFTAAQGSPTLPGNRLMVTVEDGAGEVRARWFRTLDSPYAPGAPATVDLGQSDLGPWDFTRASLYASSSSGVAWRRADGPGHLPTLYFDPRTGITDPPAGAPPGSPSPVAFLEQRIRGLRISQEQLGPQFNLYSAIDSDLLVPKRDRDDVSTMAYMLCRTIARSSRGDLGAGPDLQYFGSALGPLRCPGRAQWTDSNAGVMHTAQSILAWCSGPCLRAGTPQRVFNLLADYVVAPGAFSGLAPAGNDSGVVNGGNRTPQSVCVAGSESLAELYRPEVSQ